jgi:hypothetical protein
MTYRDMEGHIFEHDEVGVRCEDASGISIAADCDFNCSMLMGPWFVCDREATPNEDTMFPLGILQRCSRVRCVSSGQTSESHDGDGEGGEGDVEAAVLYDGALCEQRPLRANLLLGGPTKLAGPAHDVAGVVHYLHDLVRGGACLIKQHHGQAPGRPRTREHGPCAHCLRGCRVEDGGAGEEVGVYLDHSS